MNKRIISLLSFGLFLILAGGIGKFFNWDQATIILALGLSFETLAIILFAWNRIKK